MPDKNPRTGSAGRPCDWPKQSKQRLCARHYFKVTPKQNLAADLVLSSADIIDAIPQRSALHHPTQQFLPPYARLAIAMTSALAMPVLKTSGGIPVGLQLIGRARGEAKVLSVARAIELAVDFAARR